MATIKTSNLKGKVAVVTGGSRGIGRECCLLLAKHGCNIAILAKSTTDTPELPGTIFTVAKEVEKLGVQALPLQCDIRDDKKVEACVAKIAETFGRIDILINNASALWWHSIEMTPMKKYDLITSINARGTFTLSKYCLPHMQKNKFGRVITMSPPITVRGFKGRTAYNISKFGMTMVAMGVAEEYKGKNITGNSLWPATVVESQAAKNFKLGQTDMWRKATILADAVLGIVCEDGSYTGNMLIDDEYLMDRQGFTEADLDRYRYNPDVKPPRVLAQVESEYMVRRGDVKKLDRDLTLSDKRAKL
jgi:NAD(P)-dependent dehydrogenase (short-subunit alcohol dehydrogenase family)